MVKKIFLSLCISALLVIAAVIVGSVILVAASAGQNQFDVGVARTPRSTRSTHEGLVLLDLAAHGRGL